MREAREKKNPAELLKALSGFSVLNDVRRDQRTRPYGHWLVPYML